jgi:neutral amino acid transport system permease protein
MVGYLISLAISIAIYALFSLGLNLQWGYTGLINFGHIAFMTLGAYATVLLSQNGVPIFLAALAGASLAAFLGLLIGLSTLRLREDYLAIVTIGVSEVLRLVATNEEWLTQGTRGVVNFPLPLNDSDLNVVLKLGMSGILVVILGLSLWTGWNWMSQLPQGNRLRSRNRKILAFVGYLICLALLVVSLWLGFSLNKGFFVLGIVPLLVGIGLPYTVLEQPLQRIKTQNWNTWAALATATFTFGLAGMLFWADLVGLWDNYNYKAGKAGLLWLLIVTVALVFWRLQALVNSPWGRVLKAIREDEEVAKALGKNVFRYKLQSLMMGGAIAGIAGSFFAWQLTYINPDGFIPLVTFNAWIIVVLGGSGNNVGTLLGAAIFWAYDAITRLGLPAILPLDTARLGAFRVMLIGLLMIVLMMWRPQGILGNKEELTLGK